MPRNYLLSKFLVAILVSDPGHVLMQCTDKYCFDFSISLKYNICSTFSASNKHKMFAKLKISSNSEIKVKNGYYDHP